MRLRRSAAPALAALAALGAAAGHAAAADPILPLSEVRPGMMAEGRTVVRGTDIVRFPVTIIDVQRSADGPGPESTRILARAEGPVIAAAGGFVLGMSGSPIYVTGPDGVARVIGAGSTGTGDEANVLFGITPIEQMLDSSAGQRSLSLPPASARPTRRMVNVRDRAAAVRMERRRPDVVAMYPLERWSVAGLSRPLVAPLSRELARSGIRIDSIGPRTLRPPVPLVPGASMFVGLAGGDLAIGALGTVTYVDGSTILGLGHPFLGAGRTKLLLADAYVYETIPAPITNTSFKLGEGQNLQGMITGDRADGVTGTMGSVEAIDAVSTARDLARGTESTVHLTLAQEDRILPLMTAILQDEAALRTRDGLSKGTETLRVVISSPVLPRPITYRNVYASAGEPAALASGSASRIVAILAQNTIREVPISAIRIEERFESRVRAARLVGASVRPRKVRAGQRALLNLRLQPWRSTARTVQVPVTIPRDLGSGPALLRIVPKNTSGFDPFPADLTDALLGASVATGNRRAVVLAERTAARAKGSRIERLIAGVKRALDDRNDAVRLLGPDDDADNPPDGLTVPVPYVIYGGRAAAAVVVR